MLKKLETWKKFARILLVCMSVFVLAGCVNSTDTIDCVILLGYHKNAPVPNVQELKANILALCLLEGSSVSEIIIDGSPYEAFSIDIPSVKKNISSSKKEEIANSRCEEIMGALLTAKAKTEEVDILQALSLGVRELSSKNGTIKQLFVLDVGLPTLGVLSFQEISLSNLDVEATIANLKSEGELPDFSCVDSITWIGLADTVQPQANLSQKNREKLKLFWSTLLQEAGAKEVVFSDALPNSTADASNIELPSVSTIDVSTTISVVSQEEITKELEEESICETTFVLPEEVVKFKPGSAELLTDRTEVQEVLKPFIDYLLKHEDKCILLAGTTASAGIQEELVGLAEARSNTIRTILLDSGVAENQLQILGLGFEHPLYTNDRDENGVFVEELGKQNRNVIIMDKESETAQMLLEFWAGN